jgi:hypothetical protein
MKTKITILIILCSAPLLAWTQIQPGGRPPVVTPANPPLNAAGRPPAGTPANPPVGAPANPPNNGYNNNNGMIPPGNGNGNIIQGTPPNNGYNNNNGMIPPAPTNNIQPDAASLNNTAPGNIPWHGSGDFYNKNNSGSWHGSGDLPTNGWHGSGNFNDNGNNNPSFNNGGITNR